MHSSTDAFSSGAARKPTFAYDFSSPADLSSGRREMSMSSTLWGETLMKDDGGGEGTSFSDSDDESWNKSERSSRGNSHRRSSANSRRHDSGHSRGYQCNGWILATLNRLGYFLCGGGGYSNHRHTDDEERRWASRSTPVFDDEYADDESPSIYS